MYIYIYTILQMGCVVLQNNPPTPPLTPVPPPTPTPTPSHPPTYLSPTIGVIVLLLEQTTVCM